MSNHLDDEVDFIEDNEEDLNEQKNSAEDAIDNSAEGYESDNEEEKGEGNENGTTAENKAGKKRNRDGSEAGEIDDNGQHGQVKQMKLRALTTERGRGSGHQNNSNSEHHSKNRGRSPEQKNKDEERIPNILFVTRYGYNRPIFESDLDELFRPFGTIDKITMKGTIAFIEFAHSDEAANAKAALHKIKALNSDSIIVDFKKVNAENNNDKRDDRGRGRRDDNRDRDIGRSWRDPPSSQRQDDAPKRVSRFATRDADPPAHSEPPPRDDFRKAADPYPPRFAPKTENSSRFRGGVDHPPKDFGGDRDRDGYQGDRDRGYANNRYPPAQDFGYGGPGRGSGGRHSNSGNSGNNYRDGYDDRDFPPPALDRYPPKASFAKDYDSFDHRGGGPNYRSFPDGPVGGGRGPPAFSGKGSDDFNPAPNKRPFVRERSNSRGRADGPPSALPPPSIGYQQPFRPPRTNSFGGGGYPQDYDNYPPGDRGGFKNYPGDDRRKSGGGGGGGGGGMHGYNDDYPPSSNNNYRQSDSGFGYRGGRGGDLGGRGGRGGGNYRD
mmetsp:Transcript_23349/g.33396  ORF Transcript_23349/g.33396 Transcript_23349/m.33396 type:complete len:550 (-) Transcript_23349:1058-2707(-)